MPKGKGKGKRLVGINADGEIDIAYQGKNQWHHELKALILRLLARCECN